jgi:hypothetical protein
MTRLLDQLRRIASWLIDEILDRDARPGRVTLTDDPATTDEQRVKIL